MDRRGFFSLGATLTIGLLVGCRDRSHDHLLLSDVLADADLARRFGRTFLDEGGTTTTGAELTQLKLILTSRGIEVPDPDAFLAALEDAIQVDFRERRIVTVDGWQVSLAEARLATLVDA